MASSDRFISSIISSRADITLPAAGSIKAFTHDKRAEWSHITAAVLLFSYGYDK